MSEETEIQEQLQNQFPCLAGKVTIQRPRRLFADVPPADFAAVFDYVVRQMKFPILCAMTGLDLEPNLGLMYNLARESGVMLNLTLIVPKIRPVVKSVVPYFPAADVYEREVVDLLGFQVTGLAEGSRYPLPDDWPPNQFPLRKDWKPEMLSKKEADHA